MISSPADSSFLRAPFHWLPLALTFLVWAAVTVVFLYFSDLCYDDHSTIKPYKDTGFMASFDWSNSDHGRLQEWLNEGYAAAHAFLLIIFALASGRDKMTILRRLFFVSVVTQILFQIQILSTRLPEPNPHNVGRKWRYIQMPVQYVYGALFIQFYTGSWLARGLSWAVSLTGIFILIPTHYLYTVDVQTGIITGLTVFLVFHWHVRTTHSICKTKLLAWYELDFLRWHVPYVEESLQRILRDEERVRSDSLDTINFVENLVVGRATSSLSTSTVPVGEEGSGKALHLGPRGNSSATNGSDDGRATRDSNAPLLSAREGNDKEEEAHVAIGSSRIGHRPAYAAGGLDGFSRHGYSANEPESDFLMEHFRAPPYCVDSATRDLTLILDLVESEYYLRPDGTPSVANVRGLGVIELTSNSGGEVKDVAAGGQDKESVVSQAVDVQYGDRNNEANTANPNEGISTHNSRALPLTTDAEGATPSGEGVICFGIKVSNSDDPVVAAAEKLNWVRRTRIIACMSLSTFILGAGLSFANELPIYIADANRPIGVPLPWDFCHEYLPHVPAHTPDILMYPLVGVGFGYLFFSRYRWVVLRRTAVWYGACMGLRCLTVPATFLPDPSPNCRMQDHPPGTTCGDLIFSGHTLTFCAALSVLWKYCDKVAVRAFVTVYSLCGVASIICSHLHYGRDVITALIVAFGCFHLVHRALVHRVDIYLEYKWLRYFEFDYFCLLVEDRQLARAGKTRRYIWIRGGAGETLAQIVDAIQRYRERRKANNK